MLKMSENWQQNGRQEEEMTQHLNKGLVNQGTRKRDGTFTTISLSFERYDDKCTHSYLLFFLNQRFLHNDAISRVVK